MRRLAPLLAVALIGAACGGGSNEAVTSPTRAPTSSSPGGSPTQSASPSTGDLKDVHVRLQEVATLEGGPLAMAVRSGDRTLYVAEKAGRVVAIQDGRVSRLLDLTSKVSSGSEQGLLGLAFPPDGRFLYVNYTDTNGDTNVVQYAMDGDRPDPGSARRILFVHQPFANHNGGHLAFGPDGYLYIGLGDGGSEGDPEHNSQNPRSRLGKMLRIDPNPSGDPPYRIPPDNPFVGRGDIRPEIWATGLRNPWRYSFDRRTGDLWIGDVGGSEREEIDFQRAGTKGGRNYGWNLMEGTVIQTDDLPPGLVLPVYEYEHSGGRCVVTGGYVYRGSAIPDVQGAYLYADYCQGDIRALRLAGGRVTENVNLGLNVPSLASFGEDQDGELYVLSLSGPVYKIVPG